VPLRNHPRAAVAGHPPALAEEAVLSVLCPVLTQELVVTEKESGLPLVAEVDWGRQSEENEEALLRAAGEERVPVRGLVLVGPDSLAVQE